MASSADNDNNTLDDPMVFIIIGKAYEREGDEGAGHNIGLGLYIVSEIVRAHGGAIRVDSDAGRGTTFSVHLPS